MNEMINASTVLFSLMTINQKNSIYYNVGIFAFSILGSVNHLLPENFNGLTHIVKMLFSNILFSLIGVNPMIGLTLSLVDLTPIFSKNKTVKTVGEILLQLPRLGIELYLLQSMYHTHFIEVVIISVCKVIYFFERRDRIKKKIRNDFSSWHSAEHIGLYLFFKVATDTDFSIKVLVGIMIVFLISNCLSIFLLNLYLVKSCLKRAPQWVTESPELVSILQEKLEKNTFHGKWHNYLIKPWASHLKLEFVTWTAIEKICDCLITNLNRDNYDLVIGVCTGGSFVGKYISLKLDLPYLPLHSKLWSNISFGQNCRQAFKYYTGVEQKPNIISVPDVSGLRVLLVDDTTFTGITLVGIKKTLLTEGKAVTVDTFVMWMKGPHKPNFFYSNKRIPIVWEWGVEVD